MREVGLDVLAVAEAAVDVAAAGHADHDGRGPLVIRAVAERRELQGHSDDDDGDVGEPFEELHPERLLLRAELRDPELDDLITIVEEVVKIEGPHILALGKRLAALLPTAQAVDGDPAAAGAAASIRSPSIATRIIEASR